MFRVVRGTRKSKSFQNSFASCPAISQNTSTSVPVLAFAAIRERHIWNYVRFSNCLLVGKLTCVVLGDFVEVASEVVVQLFFGFYRRHFDYIQSRKFGESSH
jgi:hypothetical protein